MARALFAPPEGPDLEGVSGHGSQNGRLLAGSAGPGKPAHFAFIRNSVGIVEIKGARERWIAPAALHICSRGIEESSWTTTPETVLGLRLHGSAVEDHNRKVTRTSGPGRDFSLQPRGTPTRYLAYRSIKFGQVFLPDRLLDRASDVENLPALSSRLRDDLSFVPEKTLQSLTYDYLRRAFDPNIPATSLEMEGRALLLVDWLLRLHQSPRVGVASQVGGLSPRHLRRACDFIVEHLAEDICLDELAELTGLSGKHFARAFKQSTGLPPHQYLIMQRIEAAQRRLVDARASLADIALACGFADQSHFTATFRKAVGIPPGTWRRYHAKSFSFGLDGSKTDPGRQRPHSIIRPTDFAPWLFPRRRWGCRYLSLGSDGGPSREIGAISAGYRATDAPGWIARHSHRSGSTNGRLRDRLPDAEAPGWVQVGDSH